MSLEFETNEKQSGIFSDFTRGIGEAVHEQFIDGPRQLFGAKLEPKIEHENSMAETAGKFVATSAMFIGATALAKRVPVLGAIGGGALASVVTGGTMGFLSPVKDTQGIDTRLINGGIGAATMGILEFSPGLAGKLPKIGTKLAEDTFGMSMTRTLGANGLAGALHTEGMSLANNNRMATLDELALGTGGWMATGAAFHSVGYKVGKIQEATAEARRMTAERPWQFKDVQAVDAGNMPSNFQLQPGHYSVAFESQGAPRAFDLYISEKALASGDKQAPLVTFLHGLNPKGQSPKIIRELSYNKFADEDGAVVAYLHAKDGRHGPLTGDSQNWNDTNFGYTKQDPSYSDNVAFRDMLGVIRDHVPTANTDKIAVTGFSLGGKMANRIAATTPEVSTLGTIHGTIDKFDEEIMRSGINFKPLDGVFVLGTADRVLPLRDGRGGKSFFTMLLENSGLSRPGRQSEIWAEANHSNTPLTTPSDAYSRRDWLSGNGVNRITEYVVQDGAHAIDGTHAKRNLIQFLMGVPKPPEYFDARRRTWDFVIDSIERATQRAQDRSRATA